MSIMVHANVDVAWQFSSGYCKAHPPVWQRWQTLLRFRGVEQINYKMGMQSFARGDDFQT